MSCQSDLDNRSQQLNPNNDTYWQSRGFDERPDDWEERLEEKKRTQKSKQTPKTENSTANI